MQSVQSKLENKKKNKHLSITNLAVFFVLLEMLQTIMKCCTIDDYRCDQRYTKSSVFVKTERGDDLTKKK